MPDSERKHWERVEWLFERALALPPADREGFLSRETRPGSRERVEVESLLVNHQRDFLAIRPPTTTTALSESSGEYEAAGVVHSDLSGAYLRARRRERSDTVILRTLSYGGASSVFIDRWRRLHSTLATASVPQVSIPMDLVTYEGRLALVYPDAGGEPSLPTAAGAGVLSLGQILDVVIALTRLHDLGLAHGALTPSCVWVVPESGEFRALLGVAVEGVTAFRQTPTSRFLELRADWGHRSWRCRETVRGAPVGRASDIYAVGALLFESLVGVELTPRRLRAISEHESLSSGALEEVHSRELGKWRDVVSRALAPRGSRYQCLREFAHEIEDRL